MFNVFIFICIQMPFTGREKALSVLKYARSQSNKTVQQAYIYIYIYVCVCVCSCVEVCSITVEQDCAASIYIYIVLLLYIYVCVCVCTCVEVCSITVEQDCAASIYIYIYICVCVCVCSCVEVCSITVEQDCAAVCSQKQAFVREFLRQWPTAMQIWTWHKKLKEEGC